MARKGLEVMAHFDYGEATKTLLSYWDKYHVEYLDLIPRYDALIEKKKELGLRLFNSNDSSEIRGFPKIHFLELTKRQTVENFIEEMNPKQMQRLIDEIERKVVDDCSCFKLVKKRVQFHEQDIKDQLRPRCYAPKLKTHKK